MIEHLQDLDEVIRIACEIAAELRTLPVHNTTGERAVCRKYFLKFRKSEPEFVISLGRELLEQYGLRWQAYELIQMHKAAFQMIDQAALEVFGRGINSWWATDSFARTLSGPAWLKGQIPDDLIYSWACSNDLWWRRAALVSTVALNLRSKGGLGDVPRTLAVCSILVADHEDMVAKGMSWAMRELVIHDPEAVSRFLRENEDVLAARVKREVKNKLTTGLKDPKIRKAASG